MLCALNLFAEQKFEIVTSLNMHVHTLINTRVIILYVDWFYLVYIHVVYCANTIYFDAGFVELYQIWCWAVSV